MLNTMKERELRQLAREARVRDWRRISKANLINELEKSRHYALILDYMEDYGVSFEIARDMASE